MLKFKNNELKKGLILSLNKLKECGDKYLYIEITQLGLDDNARVIDYLESIKCEDEEYNQDELEELWYYDADEVYIIDGQEEIRIYLDEQESLIECTIIEFIQLVNKAQFAEINDDGICISEGIVIMRVTSYELLEEFIDNIEYSYSSINYKEIDINLCLSESNDIYSLRIFLNNEFDEYNPIKACDDLFIEISFDGNSNIKLDDINEIFNVYIYELFIKSGLKLKLNPRFYDYSKNNEFKFDTKLDLKSKLFTKGMGDVIAIFNQAEGYNNDRAIVEYTKVIEYVGATVVRQKVTLEVQEKLSKLEEVCPNADYISELGDIYLNNKKHTTDSEIIKITIKQCCDIAELIKYAPKFIGNLKEISNNESCNFISKSISDTRNNLSHAKANYNKKGLECPDSQKEQFIVLLRNVCIQVIEWFYSTDESIRIIKEEKA